MSFVETLIWYYKGERNEALWLVLFGILVLLISAIIWKNMHSNDLLKGMFYPLLFLGILSISAGGFNAWNNQLRLAKFPEMSQNDPSEYLEKELERFEKPGGVNSWWLPLKITWSIFLLMGIGIAFVARIDFWHGFAMGLLLWGTFGWVVDGFAHQRAKFYTIELKKHE